MPPPRSASVNADSLAHEQGLIGILTNPVLANAVAGLATSATAQATIERGLLWDRRDAVIEPFGESAQQVFARVSAYRDSMDGDQVRLLCEGMALSRCCCAGAA